MSSREELDRDFIRYVETKTWPIIQRVTSLLSSLHYPMFVADSTTIRAYTGLSRDVGDIDFVFPPGVDSEWILGCVLDGHASTETRNTCASVLRPKSADRVTVNNQLVLSRLRYQLDLVYHSDTAFIIDCHFGGLVHDKAIVWRPLSAIREADIQWLEVPSMNRGCSVRLPMLSFERSVALKLEKHIGKDIVDILAALSSDSLSLNCVLNNVRDREVARQVINSARADFESIYKRFCLSYGLEHQELRPKLMSRLDLLAQEC